MLENFDRKLPSKKIPDCSTPDELSTAFMTRLTTWKTILEHTDQQLVLDEWLQWATLEKAAEQFVSTVALAARLYAQATGEPKLVETKDDVPFVCINYQNLRKIPHIQAYIGPATSIASSMTYMELGLKKLRYHGMSAARSILGDAMYADEVEKLRLEIEKDEKRTEQVKSQLNNGG